MTILQALNSYYDRMAARGEVPRVGYTRERISYAIILAPDGTVADVQDIRDISGKKPAPKMMDVPAYNGRTTNIAANRLWDKSAYTLGVEIRENEKTPKRFAEFKKIHTALLANSDDVGLLALRKFIEGWAPSRFVEPLFRQEMKDANFVFRLDGEQQFIHDRQAARTLLSANTDEIFGDLCLVTGLRAKAALKHPSIKGVYDPNSSIASVKLVSFNLDSVESYRKEQGANAPVSEAAAAQYGAALNRLLSKDSGNKVRIGDTTTAFWADAREPSDEAQEAADAADEWAAHFFELPSDKEEAAKVKAQLEAVAQGRPTSELNAKLNPGTRFYILGLAPNAARLSVRFWYDGTFGDLERRIREHWQDMAIAPPPKVWPPSAWHLLIETAAQHKSENIPALLGGELMRAILNGTRYPRSLMCAILIRIRAEQGKKNDGKSVDNVTAMRAAILRGILNRDYRLGFIKEEVPVALDETDTNAAYRLGRWFAELEAIQQDALGRDINATIRDRFYGSASSAPMRTFALLIKNSMNHLATIRKKPEKKHLAEWHDKRLEAIIAGVNQGLPLTLRLEDQARFAIGYYHQRAERFTKSTDNSEIAQSEETAS